MTKVMVNPPFHSADVPGNRSGLGRVKRLWFIRGLWIILTPLVCLLGLEVILALVGFGHPYSFFIPAEQPGVVTTNPWFMSFYRRINAASLSPSVFRVVKPKDTVRIFVLGGSAAMGTPNASFGFARVLEVLLASYYPDLRIEVINAAVPGASSSLVTSIARDCAHYQPDLFLVYTGNNEIMGAYGSQAWSGRHPRWWAIIQRLEHLRVIQGLQRIQVHQTSPKPLQTPALLQRSRIAGDDPRREKAYHVYRRNLQRICTTAFAADAAVLLSTVAVNLKDFPPLASLHRPNLTLAQQDQWERLFQQANTAQDQQRFKEALALYRQAAALDDQFALLQYRWGQCLLSMTAVEEARQHFCLACDRDALPFRSDSRLNEIVRDTHTAMPGQPVWRVDADRDLCGDGIPGDDVFQDHVHLNFAGDYAMARLLLSTVLEILQEKNWLKAKVGAVPLSREQCAQRLGDTRWDDLKALSLVDQNDAPRQP